MKYLSPLKETLSLFVLSPLDNEVTTDYINPARWILVSSTTNSTDISTRRREGR